MAELNQHDEIAGGVDRGAFYAVMSAMASRDPKRVALAEGDALTALQSIGSMLNVVADYLYLRAQHPKDSLYDLFTTRILMWLMRSIRCLIFCPSSKPRLLKLVTLALNSE